MSRVFIYHPSILADYPTIRAAVVHAAGVDNPPSPDTLRRAYREEQKGVVAQLAGTAPAELDSIAAWRRVFSRFGAKPTQYRNAAEALLRRLTKQGDIPSISTLVDIGNMVAIRHALPVAAVDRDGISGGLTVRFATGEEPFTDLGASESVQPEPGEVVFVDESGRVHARRWCWRQSAQSATGPETTDVFYVVEGHHGGAERSVADAADDLASLLATHLPSARVERWLLDPDRPSAPS